MKKINLAVFASTNGTDLQVVIDKLRSGGLNGFDLKFVLSNKKNCYALKRARQAGYKTIFIDPKNNKGKLKSKREYDKECLKACWGHEIDLIVLIGYMRVVSKVLVEAYPNKIMNIHPSLLPKYPGMDLDVHREVLLNKEKESGCTLHWVTEKLDAGPIIIQEKVQIDKEETVESLKSKVQAKEKEVILAGIKMFAKDKA